MVALTEREIDVVIAYIVPLNLWYVVPVKDFAGRKNLWFYLMGVRKDPASKSTAKPGT